MILNNKIRILYGEGNGTPLQYSCLENPMDRGAWKAAVHGVAEGEGTSIRNILRNTVRFLQKTLDSSLVCPKLTKPVLQAEKKICLNPSFLPFPLSFLMTFYTEPQYMKDKYRRLRASLVNVKMREARAPST